MIKLEVKNSPNLKNVWHIAYYIPRNHTGGEYEGLSHGIINFKYGRDFPIKFWSDYAVRELNKMGVKFDYIIRSLGSTELIATPGKPLDILAHNISRSIGVPYLSGLLAKNRTTAPMHTIHSKASRQAELEGVYCINDSSYDLSGKHILVIDDVLTSGTTSREISKTILKIWGDVSITLFFLGRTTDNPKANDDIRKELDEFYKINKL